MNKQQFWAHITFKITWFNSILMLLQMFQIPHWKQFKNHENGCKIVWYWFIFEQILPQYRFKVHLLDQLRFLCWNILSSSPNLPSRKLIPFLVSCCHQLSIDDDHTGHIECDELEAQCREIKTIMMMMIWRRGLVRGCQEVARSRSPCPRPAADKHTPPNAPTRNIQSKVQKCTQCSSMQRTLNTPHQILV